MQEPAMLDHFVETNPAAQFRPRKAVIGIGVANVAPAYVETPPEADEAQWPASKRQPHMFVAIFGVWLLSLMWFGPRLIDLVLSFEGFWIRATLTYFAVFSTIAWLYGLYNVAVVAFSFVYRRWLSNLTGPTSALTPPVAVLYTCCNDFVEASVMSCLQMDYPAYRLFLLDDSSDPRSRDRLMNSRRAMPLWFASSAALTAPVSRRETSTMPCGIIFVSPISR
jgi:hypothetical protein